MYRIGRLWSVTDVAIPEPPAARPSLLGSGAMYRRLLRYLGPYRARMAGTILFSLIAAGLEVFSFTLLVPFLQELWDKPSVAATAGASLDWIERGQRWLIDLFLDPADPMGSMRAVIIAILAITIIKNVFSWMAGQLGASVQEYVTRDLRDKVFRHLVRLPLSYFHTTKAGQIISRILVDTEQTKLVITEVVTRTIQSLAQVIVTIVVLVYWNPKLALMSFVIAPLLTLALQPILGKLRRSYRRLRGEYGEITSVLQETVSGVRLVKSFRGEAYEGERFETASHGYSKGMVRVTRVALLSQPLTELIGTSIAVLILWIGAKEVNAETMNAGVLITFMILVMRLLPPLKQLSQAPTAAQQSFAAAERLFDVLDRNPEPDAGTRPITGFSRAIEFEHVSFAYEREPVLQDISFTARRGQVVALVGPSGAGKTTLVDLIPRFYNPAAGRISIDGVDSREYSLESLRALTGIVSQDTVLFHDTVRNNIAYAAAGKYTDAQVEAAARAANAHDFIAALPQGYATVLGERGTRLSGGQRQRLAIARALLTDPPILILDEATSALDTESERLVQEAIDRLLSGRTVFVIAHRLSTVQHADLILVLEGGRVVERGTHAELIARGGSYHRLHSLQFRSDRAPVGA
jgi:ATP-binding cassette, subfamily B, bacterial MsbA